VVFRLLVNYEQACITRGKEGGRREGAVKKWRWREGKIEFVPDCWP
jgi:hypothetical protein